MSLLVYYRGAAYIYSIYLVYQVYIQTKGLGQREQGTLYDRRSYINQLKIIYHYDPRSYVDTTQGHIAIPPKVIHRHNSRSYSNTTQGHISIPPKVIYRYNSRSYIDITKGHISMNQGHILMNQGHISIWLKVKN